MLSTQYLVWIDLEMTGLDHLSDTILEIATLITDNELTILDKGLSLVIHQPPQVLDQMNEWCKKQHKLSGLASEVEASSLTVAQASALTYDYISSWCTPQSAPLCGNSVYYDRSFLKTYMPAVEQFLHYRIIDVSSIKEIARRWYPQEYALFKKSDTHRALQDINESIEELRYYSHSIFRLPRTQIT